MKSDNEHDAECDNTPVAKVEADLGTMETTSDDQKTSPWTPDVFADHLVGAVHEVFSASSGRTNREWTRNTLAAITLASQRTAQQMAHPSNEPVNLKARFHGATNLMKEVKEKTPELSGLKIEERGHVPALDAVIFDPSGRRAVIAEPEQGGARDRVTDDKKLVAVDNGEIAVSVSRPTSTTNAASAQKAACERLVKRSSPSIALGIHIPKNGKMSDYKIVGLDRINFPSDEETDN